MGNVFANKREYLVKANYKKASTGTPRGMPVDARFK